MRRRFASLVPRGSSRDPRASPEMLRLGGRDRVLTLRKRPTLQRMRDLLGVTASVSLEQGVGLVCAKVQERLGAGERPV